MKMGAHVSKREDKEREDKERRGRVGIRWKIAHNQPYLGQMSP